MEAGTLFTSKKLIERSICVPTLEHNGIHAIIHTPFQGHLTLHYGGESVLPLQLIVISVFVHSRKAQKRETLYHVSSYQMPIQETYFSEENTPYAPFSFKFCPLLLLAILTILSARTSLSYFSLPLGLLALQLMIFSNNANPSATYIGWEPRSYFRCAQWFEYASGIFFQLHPLNKRPPAAHTPFSQHDISQTVFETLS